MQKVTISMQSHNSRSSKSDPKYTIDVVAENALLLSWPAQISLSQHEEILHLQAQLKQQLHEVIVETVASYHCLMVYFAFQDVTSDQLIENINKLPSNTHHQTDKLKNADDCIKIPVYYDTDQQWDLAEVAEHCQLSINEVIQQHSSHIYHGYALGFTPGFCYLASLPKSLQLPRKSSPRVKVPKGAVAIAEQQSAVYPNESPGGWHIIGQTPLPMYQSNNGQFEATINVGKNVQFYAISKAEFIALQQSLNA